MPDTLDIDAENGTIWIRNGNLKLEGGSIVIESGNVNINGGNITLSGSITFSGSVSCPLEGSHRSRIVAVSDNFNLDAE